MPIEYIPADSRGLTQTDWLTSFHSFNFAEFYHPSKTGFGKLRVLNDDVIAPSQGFPLHFHNNMEIITLVLQGSLEHRDSVGNHGIIQAGQMQRMTAGRGIQHAEFNPSKSDPVHILQIWVVPKEKNLEPSYEQKEFASLLNPDAWQMIVAPEKQDSLLFINQDVRFFFGLIEEGNSLAHTFSSQEKGAYFFLVEGEVTIEGKTLHERDAAAIKGQIQFSITAIQPSFCLLIETPL
jgi:redox-sensitive bicupin YhaK (pirin superfamily)